MHEIIAACDSVDLLLIAGIQGSGKSTVTVNHFRDRCRANLDEIRYFYRRMTTGNSWQPSDWKKEFEPLFVTIEERILRFNLQNGRRLVVDNTNVTRESREHYIRLARELGKSVGILFMDLPLDYCLAKNAARSVQVPEQVIRGFHERRQLPTRAEGFDFVEVLGRPLPMPDSPAFPHPPSRIARPRVHEAMRAS